MQIKTISTVAGVNEIDFGNDSSQSTAHFYWFKNLGNSTLYVSAKPNPVAGEDNVAELSVKGAASIETDEGKVYVLGSGKVEIHRTNSKFCPFELPSTGSGGGSSITIDSALSETSTNPAENRVITGAINGLSNRMLNPNLLINPDFKINQRGVSGTFSETGKYFVDRWQLVSGTVTVNSDRTITLNGSIRQFFEIDFDTNVTASVSAGTITADVVSVNTGEAYVHSVTISAEGETISWAKLEMGSNATPFSPPNPATELIKCQRYYSRISADRKVFGSGYAVNTSTANIFIAMPQMLTNPDISFTNLALVGYGHTTSGASVAVSEITNIAAMPNGVSLQMISSDLTAGQIYMPIVLTDGYIGFNAEISW